MIFSVVYMQFKTFVLT